MTYGVKRCEIVEVIMSENDKITENSDFDIGGTRYSWILCVMIIMYSCGLAYCSLEMEKIVGRSTYT